MRHRILRISAALFATAVSACAPAIYSTANAYDPSVITFEQLEGVRNQSAYDAIRMLRPNFLASRGPTTLLGRSSPYATVYIDGVRYGSIDMLRQFPASWIATVRSHRVSSASFLGMTEMGGVLEITTRQH